MSLSQRRLRKKNASDELLIACLFGPVCDARGCSPPARPEKLSCGRDLRSRYSLERDDRYCHRNGYLYQVDPRTMLVEQVVRALLR